MDIVVSNDQICCIYDMYNLMEVGTFYDNFQSNDREYHIYDRYNSMVLGTIWMDIWMHDFGTNEQRFYFHECN